MHIAIEGLDGVGKTQTARCFSKKYGFWFVEKPLHYLTDVQGMDNYLRMMNRVNTEMDPDFQALYYGLGNLYLRRIAKGKQIVTDRDLCSTYFWNKTRENQALFDELVRLCGLPDLIVILYAGVEVRRGRILGRNAMDPDLKNKVLQDACYEKMREFVTRYHARYIWVDNSDLTIDETVQKIADAVEKEAFSLHG